MAGTTTVALLGTGLLGTAIGQRLLEQNTALRAWNRSPERLQPLVDLGARGCHEPQEALEGCDWVITVLSDGAATRSVLERCQLRGQRVLQMATIAPGESRELGAAIGAAGGAYLEVPVLGSRPEALAGRLQVMAAGPQWLFDAALPVLRQLGPEPRLLGPLGTALATKLALNQLIASLTHAFSLSLHLVQASGVGVEPFMELLRGSALHAATFDKKLPRLLTDDYDQPNFPTAHLRKDLLLFLAEARQHQLDARGLQGLAELLSTAEGSAIDALDYSALHRLTAGAGQQH